MLNRPINCVFISLLTLILCGCGGGTRVKPDESAPIIKSETGTAVRTSAVKDADPQELINLAQQKKSPPRETLLLQAAEIYLNQNKLDRARNLIGELNAAQLTEQNFITFSQVSAGIALKDGDIERARRILTIPRIEQQLKSLEPAQEAAIRELRAQIFERTGQLQDSIAERINASAILTDNQAANANQDLLWQTLMALPLSDLQKNAAKGSGGITQGWYSLAALSKNPQDSNAQLASLSQWLKQWRTHPAAANLPKDLRALQSINGDQPKKIALLLPLQGRLAEAGEAVSDGFFASYYQHIGNTTLPEVRRYDASKNVVDAYKQAVSDGADFIIGPIDKDNVNAISKLPSLSVPLLSLNYPDQQPVQPLANFYQFGLAVEDESRQAARQAYQDGYRRALIVYTAQEVSERSAQAFLTEWQKLGGAVIGKTIFASQDKFSESFRHLMLLDESQSRATLLQQQLGTKLEFVPRRRADVNMIFMAVTPDQGRQIKPTLVFQYANSIPVYATSGIYSGDVDAVKNEDLNDVMFNTLPWVFDNNNPVKQVIAQTTKSAAVYGRLHALGVDAFQLYSRLAQLKQAPQIKLYGATGSLQLTTDGRIEREQIWAHFNNGLAEPMTTTADIPTQGTSE